MGLGSNQRQEVEDLIARATAPLISELKSSKAEIAELKAEIARLKKEASKQPKTHATAATPMLFSQVVSGGKKVSVSQVEANILNAVSIEAKAKLDREKNILIVGATLSTTASNATERAEADKMTARDVLREIGCEQTAVERTQRISKPGATNSMICVTLASKERVRNVLSNSRKLSASTQHKSVFIRPDRTVAEQHIYRELLKQKKEANKALSDNGQPPNYRWVIRDNKIRCIDLSLSKAGHSHYINTPPPMPQTHAQQPSVQQQRTAQSTQK